MMYNNSNNQFLKQLPDHFSRKDLLRLTVNEGYSIGKADQILEYETIKGSIERIARGKYRKIENKTTRAMELKEMGYSYREIADEMNISKSQVGNLLTGQAGQL